MSSEKNACASDVEIRSHEHLVLVRGNDVPLSSREFEIVRTLAEHPGWVFSAIQLSGDSDEDDYSPESVSVLISRIRRKLADAGAPDVIETVRGAGYRLHSAGGQRIASPDESATGRELRDASWRLQEALIDVEHSGSPEQWRAATDVLEQARRAIFASLAE